MSSKAAKGAPAKGGKPATPPTAPAAAAASPGVAAGTGATAVKPSANTVSSVAAPPNVPAATGTKPDESTANGAASAAASVPVDDNSVVFSVNVHQARNLRGSKGEKVTTFVRIQFADFEYKDSPPVNEDGNPFYNFNVDQSFHLDSNLVETFANKKLTLSVFEVLPKEKTALLGTVDVPIGSHLLKSPSGLPALATQQSNAAAPAVQTHSGQIGNGSSAISQSGAPGQLLSQTSATKISEMGAAPGATSTAQASASTVGIQQPPSEATAPVTYHASSPIVYANPKMLTNNEKPEIEFSLALSQPVLQPKDLDTGNFLYIKLDDIWPVPEDWTLKEGNEKDINSNIYTYTLHISIPTSSTGERVISIPGGTLVPSDPLFIPAELPGPQAITVAGSKPQGKLERVEGGVSIFEALVASSGSTTQGSTNSPGTATSPSGSSGVPVPGDPRKVHWGTTYTVWLTADSVAALRERILQKRVLDAELVRDIQPRFAAVVDPNKEKYRGKLSLDCSQLLFPRVTGVKGRFAVTPFDTPMPIADGTDASLTSLQEHPFIKARTSLGLEILCEKVLLDKKKLQPVTKSVRDFISKHASLSHATTPVAGFPIFQPDGSMAPSRVFTGKTAHRAGEEFRMHVQDIGRSLVNEYLALLKSDLDSQESAQSEHTVSLASGFANIKIESESDAEEQARKKRFLYHLNKNGTYFAFKERLKSSVVEVVRERFQKKSPFASPAELQLFMSEIYVYLVEQMHVSISEMFTSPERVLRSPLNKKLADVTNLKSFADMAEEDRNILAANAYHAERLARFDDVQQVWFDYACFCKRTGMSTKGDECFKEILSRDSKQIPTLLAYGVHCTLQEKFEEARVYLHSAVEAQPGYALAHTLLSLYYDIIGEDEEAEAELARANSFQKDGSSVYLLASEFLVSCHAGSFAERALAQEIIQHGPTVWPYLLLARLEVQRGNYVLAMDHIRKAIEMKQDDPNPWAALGHLQYIQKNFNDALVSYETVLSLPQDAKDLHLIYTRLGLIHLLKALGGAHVTTAIPKGGLNPAQAQEARTAKTMLLRACELAPSSRTWLGVGRACMVLSELDEAEDALAEANVLNNRDSDVWAHLALLCMLQKRVFEANQAVAQALRLGIKEPVVLKSLGVAFLEAGHASPAAECFRMCLEVDPHDEITKALFVRALDANTPAIAPIAAPTLSEKRKEASMSAVAVAAPSTTHMTHPASTTALQTTARPASPRQQQATTLKSQHSSANLLNRSPNSSGAAARPPSARGGGATRA